MSATNLEIHAAGQVNTVPGVPVFIWQTGEWAAAITDTGVGDVTLTFNASNGIDAAEAVWKCTVIAVAARITISVDHLTDTTARFRIFSEATGAAADALFTVMCWRRNLI